MRIVQEWIWTVKCKIIFAKIIRKVYSTYSSDVFREVAKIDALQYAYRELQNEAIRKTIINYGGDYVKILDKEYSLVQQKQYVKHKDLGRKTIKTLNIIATIIKWVILAPFMVIMAPYVLIFGVFGLILTLIGNFFRWLFKRD